MAKIYIYLYIHLSLPFTRPDFSHKSTSLDSISTAQSIITPRRPMSNLLWLWAIYVGPALSANTYDIPLPNLTDITSLGYASMSSPSQFYICWPSFHLYWTFNSGSPSCCAHWTWASRGSLLHYLLLISRKYFSLSQSMHILSSFQTQWLCL